MSDTKYVKIIRQGQPGSFKWKVVHDGHGSDDPQHYPRVKLSKDSGPHLIFFKLSGNDNGVTFSQDPIWVKAGGKPGPKAADPQIPFAVPVENGKALVVLDLNDNDASTALELNYQLNFVNADPVDPIIENGGGTFHPPAPPPPPATFLGIGVSAVSIAVAVGLVIIGAVIGRLLWR